VTDEGIPSIGSCRGGRGEGKACGVRLGGGGLPRTHRVAVAPASRDRMFQTKDLLAAAEELHRAIRAAIDPEAFRDFHGDHPFIELRDPADITRPWRPGAEIADRQAATMAQIEADLRNRAQ